MGVILPGTPRRERYIAPREPGDVVSIRNEAEVRTVILEALQAGPLEKWQIREAIHEEDHRIARQLTNLRDAGEVKKIGNRRLARYALRGWEEPMSTPTHRAGTSPSIGPKLQPPSTSWWIGRDRSGFQEQLSNELPRMTRSGVGRTVKPMTVGDI